jgi:hypothetical protein
MWWIGDEGSCAVGKKQGWLYNTRNDSTRKISAPTLLPSDEWVSALVPQYNAANGSVEFPWVRVPSLLVNPMNALNDRNPAMAAALRQLAALAENGNV